MEGGVRRDRAGRSGWRSRLLVLGRILCCLCSPLSAFLFLSPSVPGDGLFFAQYAVRVTVAHVDIAGWHRPALVPCSTQHAVRVSQSRLAILGQLSLHHGEPPVCALSSLQGESHVYCLPLTPSQRPI